MSAVNTRKAFDKIAKAVDEGKFPDEPKTWKAGPWKDAVAEVEGMLTGDIVPGFRKDQLGVQAQGYASLVCPANDSLNEETRRLVSDPGKVGWPGGRVR